MTSYSRHTRFYVRATRHKLVKLLAAEGIVAVGNYQAIAKLATEKDISLFEIDLPRIREEWEGKRKGVYQVLRGREWLDPEAIKHYTMYGRKDEYGVFQSHSSLKYPLRSCRDFQEEESLLQSMGQQTMGAIVARTPKCHCELAGEGIEYSWGSCAKNNYQTIPIREKNQKSYSRNLLVNA
jgi:hypothetical protein